METHEQMSPPSPRNESSESGQWYWHVVAVLLVVVIGCLAYLWFAEKKQNRFLRDRLAAMTKSENQIVDILNKGFSSLVAPAQADEKSSREATVDGQPRKVVVIDETVGARLGFAQGDVIFVKKQPPGPATAPR